MRIIFALYLGALSRIGAIGRRPSGTAGSGVDSEMEMPDSVAFEQVDLRARALGETYRGIGILVIALGVLAVLCAVAPLALESGHESTKLWAICEVALMASIVAAVAWLHHARIRDQWIEVRRAAEVLRYAGLHSQLGSLSSALAQGHDASGAAATLQRELDETLRAQVGYNQHKHEHYEQIEHAASVVGLIVFASACAAAVAHLFVHWPWLLFFTAIAPLLAGALHGINGFLRLSDLSDAHRDTALRLQAIVERMAGWVDAPPEPAKLLELGNEGYAVLVSGDARWREMARTLNPKLG